MEKANSLHYWHNLLKHLKLTLAIILRSLTHTGRGEIIVHSVNIDIACYCLQIALLCIFIFVFVYLYIKYKSVSTSIACGNFSWFMLFFEGSTLHLILMDCTSQPGNVLPEFVTWLTVNSVDVSTIIIALMSTLRSLLMFWPSLIELDFEESQRRVGIGLAILILLFDFL